MTADPDPHLIARIESIRRETERLRDASCARCSKPLCRHEEVFLVASGYGDDPMCLGCLAGELRRDRVELRDSLLMYVMSKECYRTHWAKANAAEGYAAAAVPACLSGGAAMTRDAAGKAAATGASEPHAEAAWDAGDMGCGELVFELKLKLAGIAPGALFRVLARDSGAPEDMPAWCGLTGHSLVFANHPVYVIRKKES